MADAAHAQQRVAEDREVTHEPAIVAVTAVSGVNDLHVSTGLRGCAIEVTEAPAGGFPKECKTLTRSRS
jgi:hypothetical protein